MKKRLVQLATVLSLALAFSLCFFAKDAKAATEAHTVYVNGDRHIVVCFEKETSGSFKLINDKDEEVAADDFGATSKLTINHTLGEARKYYLTVSGISGKIAIMADKSANLGDISLGSNTITAKATKAKNLEGWVLGVYSTANGVSKAAYTTKDSQSVAMGTAPAGSYNVLAIAAQKDKTDDIIYGYATGKTYSYQPTIASFKAVSQIKKAKLTWSKISADGVRVKYKVSGGSWKYKNFKATDGKIGEAIIPSLTAGKTYYFSVRPYYLSKDGKEVYTNGKYTAQKSAKILSDPGKVTKVKFTVDNHGVLMLQWSKVKNATSYGVYYKTGTEKYQLVGNRTGTKCLLGDLPKKKKCTVIVYARINGDRSSKHSDAKSITPSKWFADPENALRIMAKRVKGITYKGGKCRINTKISYTNETIEAYCNYFTSHNSKTGYVVWISLYTQQGAIMVGKKGHWKIATDMNMPGLVNGRFDCSGGSYENRTRRGLNKIFLREKHWVHPSTTSWWISHFYKKCSIHSFPCWNKKIPEGKTHPPYQDPRLRQPVSNACVRVSYELAKWIYNNIPMGTQVRCK